MEWLRVNVGVVIAAAIILFAAFIWWLESADCPREIAGWNCRGSNCDHSEEAIKRAKKARGDF